MPGKGEYGKSLFDHLTYKRWVQKKVKGVSIFLEVELNLEKVYDSRQEVNVQSINVEV